MARLLTISEMLLVTAKHSPADAAQFEQRITAIINEIADGIAGEYNCRHGDVHPIDADGEGLMVAFSGTGTVPDEIAPFDPDGEWDDSPAPAQRAR